MLSSPLFLDSLLLSSFTVLGVCSSNTDIVITMVLGKTRRQHIFSVCNFLKHAYQKATSVTVFTTTSIWNFHFHNITTINLFCQLKCICFLFLRVIFCKKLANPYFFLSYCYNFLWIVCCFEFHSHSEVLGFISRFHRIFMQYTDSSSHLLHISSSLCFHPNFNYIYFINYILIEHVYLLHDF